ncbi:hypothetical protein PVAP13_4KG309915 [Panicum virgatum]|uniref:Uncharacterized protein n=1 Tax=Panicum virgatum TaxID=38727 RepID=A0A8T0TSR2_PANVG|nr:hypothetical protein PVAP13_4KG309915 [Panicum virgatum]
MFAVSYMWIPPGRLSFPIAGSYRGAPPRPAPPAVRPCRAGRRARPRLPLPIPSPRCRALAAPLPAPPLPPHRPRRAHLPARPCSLLPSPRRSHCSSPLPPHRPARRPLGEAELSPERIHHSFPTGLPESCVFPKVAAHHTSTTASNPRRSESPLPKPTLR